jgi:hypothetical protein
MSQLDEALKLASLGYFVFRVKERGKVPLTEHGFKDATRDERTILHAWDSVPGANIGIDLARSGVFVLDIDPKEGIDPEDVIGALALDRDALVVVRTGEAPEPDAEYPNSLAGVRGAHLYFRGHAPTCKTTIPGVEFRGDGAYVVAPGSFHASGVRYAGELPEVNGARPVPERIERLLRASRAPERVAPAVEGPIPSGARNDTLTSFAGSMRRRGMTEASILAALRVENARCSPPLEDRELQTIAHSIGRKPADDSAVPEVEPEPPADPREFTHARIVTDLAEWIARADEPPPWRVEPLAADGAVTTLAGMRGESKSWLALALCAGVARGAGVAGLRCERGRALYIDGENGRRTMGRRFKLLGLAPEVFVMADGNGLHLPRDASTVRTLIKGTRANLCVLDSLRRLAPMAREDKSDDMAPIFAALAAIAQETGCAIVVLHHRSTKFDAPDTRGSSAIEDQSDLIYVLERERMDPEGLNRKRLRCTKNRIDREPKPRWIRFERVADVMTISPTEPYEGNDDDEPSALATMVEGIESLAPRVLKDGAWPPGRLADALGVDQSNGTFKRALRRLVDGLKWEALGATRARVYRPRPDSGQPAGPNDPNGSPEPLFPDGDRDSGFGPVDPNWKPYRPESPEDDDEEDAEDDWRQR